MKTCVIIVAAGSGERIGGNIPKQYLKISDRSILEHTISAFEISKSIDEIVIAINPDHHQFYKNIKSNKKIYFINGGSTRQESVKNALEFLENKSPEKVLIHDAARPFINSDIIEQIVLELDTHKAVELVSKCVDTVEYDGNYIDRNRLRFAQTPQGFEFKTILKLHRDNTEVQYTDDISLTKKEAIKVKSIIGNRSNFKITTIDDFELATTLIDRNYMIRTGFGYDVHQIELKKHSKIYLGGVEMDSDYKIIAHSDGDVVIHAVVDAILGALSLGDIGHYFPPSEQKWKGASSSIFLSKCTELLRENSAFINNIDVSIVAESPKIKPHIDSMKLRLAEILEITQNQVGIKATTSENLGFIGRKEGVAAHAVATIRIKQGYL